MINKYLATIIAVIATCSFTNAQEAKSGRLEFGVQGGINTSTADTHFRSNKYKFGYNAGATFTYYMGDAFSLNTGLEYAKKGSDTKQDFNYSFQGEEKTSFEPDGRISKNYELGYIQLPIAIGYEFIQKAKLSVDFRFGFNFAYGINASAKETIKGTLHSPNEPSKYIEQTTKYTDWNWLDMHRFDFGILGGMAVKHDRLFVKATYNYGLTNIGNSIVNNGKYKSRWKNRDFTLSVGYNFIVK